MLSSRTFPFEVIPQNVKYSKYKIDREIAIIEILHILIDKLIFRLDYLI